MGCILWGSKCYSCWILKSYLIIINVFREKGCNFWLISGLFVQYLASLWLVWLVCGWFGWFVGGLANLWVVSSFTANENQIGLLYFASNCFSYLETDMRFVGSFLDAAVDGNVKTVDRMLRDGMPVDVRDEYGETALHLATTSNKTNVVQHLLQEGADVKRQTQNSKKTPFHYAAELNYTEVVRLLVRKGADINISSEGNKTPLDVARKGSEIESLLLQLQQSAP